MTKGREWRSEGHVDRAAAGRENEGTNAKEGFPDRNLEAANAKLEREGKRRSLSTSSK